MPEVITDNLDLWSSALLTKPTAGRGSNGKLEAYGIKKLRELILELAVRGKLVPQDPNDEPASAVLERVEETRRQTQSKGFNKEEDGLSQITDDEFPYQAPDGWEWSRFIDVLDFQGGSQPPKSRFSDTNREGYVQLIQIRDLGPSPQPVYVSKDSVSKFCTQDDIMIGRYGASVGKVFWGQEGAYNVALIKLIDEHEIFDRRFLFNLMQSPVGQSYFLGISRSAQDGFSKNDIAYRLVPIPPLNEQHRIVAKVDELMAMCDQLEQQQTHSLEAHQTLVASLLGTLTRVESQQEFSAAWARIASHFDTLFTTEASIDQLKQTILQLAVMGKLVPQDLNDEPASELLKRIQVERARLIAQGQIKQDTGLEIADDEKYFVLPEGWEYARLADITSVLNGRAYAKDELLDAGIPVLRVGNLFTSSHWYYSNLELEEDKYCDSGDLIFAWSASFGPFIWPGPKVIYHYHIWKLKLHSEANLNKLFLYKFLLEKTEEMKASGHGVSMIHMTKQAMEKIVVPVPPLAEQSRIVAKVDELMALCDSLKARIKDAQAIQIHLADAIVEQAIC